MVTRDLRQMAERFEVVFGTFLNDWEEIICGPRNSLQQCEWKYVDLDWIIGYYEYIIFFIDRCDQSLEWYETDALRGNIKMYFFRFAFTIGNILDATVNKPNSTVTPDTY